MTSRFACTLAAPAPGRGRVRGAPRGQSPASPPHPPLPRGREGSRSPSGSFALPLALAFAALFLAPLLLLVGVSFFNDDKITQPGLGSWIKFFGDPFSYKVIGDTLLLGVKTVCATVLIGYPLALVYLDLPARLQKVLIFIIVHAAAAVGRGSHLRLDRRAGPRGHGQPGAAGRSASSPSRCACCRPSSAW